jgi:hypothetical protein
VDGQPQPAAWVVALWGARMPKWQGTNQNKMTKEWRMMMGTKADESE